MKKNETIRAALYARVSTHDQQTLPMQIKAMKEYARRKGYAVVLQIEEIGSGAKTRPQREEMLKAARRREIDCIIVWRLDRFGRSLSDLAARLTELHELGVGFVSITEALDFTTPTGRAMAGMMAVFAEFERELIRERVKAGVAASREKGKRHGRPATAQKLAEEVKDLYQNGKGLSKSAISKRLGISRSSIGRILGG